MFKSVDNTHDAVAECAKHRWSENLGEKICEIFGRLDVVNLDFFGTTTGELAHINDMMSAVSPELNHASRHCVCPPPPP